MGNTLKNYHTHDDVLNSSELIIQINHATIILFPIVGLCYLNYITEKYRTQIMWILIACIVEAIISIINHMFIHKGKTGPLPIIFNILDTFGCIALTVISILLISDVIFIDKPNKLGKTKDVFRLAYAFVFVLMAAAYIWGGLINSKSIKKSLSETERTNIYNMYHSLWHVLGSILLLIIVLYVFMTNKSNNSNL